MKCENCGTENVSTGRFCMKCGAKLDVAPKVEAFIAAEPLKVKVKVSPGSPSSHIEQSAPSINEPAQESPSVQTEKPKKPRRILRTAVFALVACCLCAGPSFGVYLYMNRQISQQAAQIEELKTDKENNEYTIARQDENYNKLRKRLDEAWAISNDCAVKADFLDDNVVFATVGGRKYHNFDCHYFQDSSAGYYIYNSENAEYQGYKKCLECN